MLSAGDVAALLKVSARTVWRMAKAGRIPEPVRMGLLVRWSRAEINDWLAAGCPKREGTK